MDETGSKGAAIHEVKAQAGRKAKRVEASSQLLPDAATCCQERRTGRIEIHTFKVGVARKNVKRRNEDCRDLKGPGWRDESVDCQCKTERDDVTGRGSAEDDGGEKRDGGRMYVEPETNVAVPDGRAEY